MTRSVPEWIGKTDNTPVPRRVRLRVFNGADGGHCRGCSRKIMAGWKWQCDHIVSLIDGGENRERNLQLLCDWCHKAKTKEDVARKSVTARKRMKHLGIRKKRRTIPGRKFDGTPIASRIVQ